MTPLGYVEFGSNSNIDSLTFNLSANSMIRTLGTGTMGQLTMSNGMFIAQHKGAMYSPQITGGSLTNGIPVVLLQGQIQLISNGSDSYRNSATFGITYLSGISTLQMDMTTYGRINFTGFGPGN